MRYQQSVEQSAEFLRLALPRMSRQAAGLHPISYAVWYEYVAGINPPLVAAVDELTRGEVRLDEAQTLQLFQKHVAEIDEATARRVSAGLRQVLTGISESAACAGDQANQFGSQLEKWSDILGRGPFGAEASQALAAVLGDTRVMQGAIGALTARLAESQREIERLRLEVERAREDALVDALTGLSNRRGFDLSLAACLGSAANDAPAGERAAGMVGPSLLMADIDHFKRVNDSFGHLFGDKVICALAQIIKQNVKGMDIAARYGGEEFVILLPETSLPGARCVAEKIRTTIEGARIRRSDNRQELAQVTVSFGVACRVPGEPANQLIERADGALYRSKELGRNRVTVAA